MQLLCVCTLTLSATGLEGAAALCLGGDVAGTGCCLGGDVAGTGCCLGGDVAGTGCCEPPSEYWLGPHLTLLVVVATGIS